MSDPSYTGHTDLCSIVLFYNEVKGIQYRLTVSEFYDVQYIGIREWYMNFEGNFAPTKNGVTLPYNLHTLSQLHYALNAMSIAGECVDVVEKEAATIAKLKLEWYDKHIGLDPRLISGTSRTEYNTIEVQFNDRFYEES